MHTQKDQGSPEVPQVPDGMRSATRSSLRGCEIARIGPRESSPRASIDAVVFRRNTSLAANRPVKSLMGRQRVHFTE